MYFHTAIIAFVLLVLVNAATIHVDVGKGGAINFHPDTIIASEGDVVEFHFYTGSNPHNVVNGPFEKPCTHADGTPEAPLFFSGNLDGDKDGNTTFSITIPNKNPIWIYCSVRQHCQHGMAGVINPPALNQGLSQYRAEAAIVKNSTAPSSPLTWDNTNGNGNSTTPGNSTATTTGNATVTTAKPTASNGHHTSTTSSPSAISSSTGAAFMVTPEMGSFVAGVLGSIGAAFL